MVKAAVKARTCFVISPIGPDGSDIRKRANSFLNHLVEPALERYSFQIIRADRIPTPTAITADVVRLVQESDLCIIDITDNNPNVFYECGRRHETGRPYIQLLDKNATGAIPFDLAGIRTLGYDLSSLDSARVSVRELQEYIDVIVEAGFPSAASGESMSSIAQALERIERRLSQISSVGGSPSPTASTELGDLLKPPHQKFRDYLLSGNLEAAFQIARKMLEKAPEENESWARVCFLSSVGHIPSFEKVLDELEEISAKLQLDAEELERIKIICSSVKMHGDSTLDYARPLDRLTKFFEEFSKKHPNQTEVIGFCANQIGMCYWTANDFDSCEYYSGLAVKYRPESPSYIYNLSLVYEYKDDSKRLRSALEQLRACSDLDSDHIALLKRHFPE